MRPFSRMLRVLAIAPLAVWALSGPVLAQEATPAAGEENPRIVEPSECQGEARPVDQITQVLQLDGEGITAPAAMTITPPLGETADRETELAIKEAARQIIACFNAQDLPRAAALMTDNGLRSAFWGLSSSAAAREATKATLAAAPQPRAEAALTRLISVTDVSRLPDGRMAAFVITEDPLLPPTGAEALLFVFAQQGDTWLLDDLIRFVVVPPAGAATATP